MIGPSLYNPGLEWHHAPGAERLGQILQSWRGTPYSHSQASRGAGVYCTAFVTRVLDEMLQRAETPLPEIPHDAAFHSPETARGGLRWFLRHFPTARPVKTVDGVRCVQPGDVLVTGPIQGGPGHAIIIGSEPRTMWQATACGVHFTGLMIPRAWDLHAVYRVI